MLCSSSKILTDGALMKKILMANISCTTGMALFAMFFGAGNIVFPLMIGATAGGNFIYTLGAFLISAVGMPLLGLYAVGLYKGNYWEFFRILGRVPAFIVVTFLICIIGPLFASPRTEVIVYKSLLPFLPDILSNGYFFSALYFALVFILVFNKKYVIDVIGKLISPIKLGSFFTLIVLGVWGKHAYFDSSEELWNSMSNAFSTGYGTMDLLGAFFYCHVAYASIFHKCVKNNITSEAKIISLYLKSCMIGGVLLALVYIGFACAAYNNAMFLQGVDPAAIINKISQVILGDFGSLFVCVSVSFACLATATALTEVSADYFGRLPGLQKVPRFIYVLCILSVMFAMSLIGFSGIMQIASPILDYLYPALIVLCIINIILKRREAINTSKSTLCVEAN